MGGHVFGFGVMQDIKDLGLNMRFLPSRMAAPVATSWVRVQGLFCVHLGTIWLYSQLIYSGLVYSGINLGGCQGSVRGYFSRLPGFVH